MNDIAEVSDKCFENPEIEFPPRCCENPNAKKTASVGFAAVQKRINLVDAEKCSKMCLLSLLVAKRSALIHLRSGLSKFG